MPIAVAEGVGILVWSPLAGGLLSRQVRARHAVGAAGRRAGTSRRSATSTRLWRIVDVLKEVGAAHGVSAAQVALAWLLGRPGVASLVIGGRNARPVPRQPRRRPSCVLAPEERARLDAVSAPPVIYPYWHQNRTRRSRRFGPADFRGRERAEPGASLGKRRRRVAICSGSTPKETPDADAQQGLRRPRAS